MNKIKYKKALDFAYKIHFDQKRKKTKAKKLTDAICRSLPRLDRR